MIENQKYKLRDITVILCDSEDLGDLSNAACKRFIDCAEGEEIDYKERKIYF